MYTHMLCIYVIYIYTYIHTLCIYIYIFIYLFIYLFTYIHIFTSMAASMKLLNSSQDQLDLLLTVGGSETTRAGAGALRAVQRERLVVASEVGLSHGSSNLRP